MFNRIIIVVMDSVGIGALPDAGEYGDCNANTLANIARWQGGLFLPTLEKLGLGCISPIDGIKNVPVPQASYGKMAEISKGKDTISGHWEMAGSPVFTMFPVYPKGFPFELLQEFKRHTGYEILGNKPASGTVIIAELGDEHLRTGKPIVYTSGDSVFQIAAHEAVIPLEKLYEICKITREKVCVGEHAVARIIARPFIGSKGNFIRTANRHDYSLTPAFPTILDQMKAAGYAVSGIGKIADIFAQRGLTQSYPTRSNAHGLETIIRLVRDTRDKGMIMANLVDFDSVYGHRNDVPGYAAALKQLDEQLPILLAELQKDDLLILTADHGCDPTTEGTDHTREYVPLLVYRQGQTGTNLGMRQTFADVAASVADNFGLSPMNYGMSFIREILR